MPNVLIVDDDAGVRDILAEFLRDTGCHVRLAENGREAVEVLKHEGGWVILLDWNMPQFDGAGVIEYLAHHAVLQGNIVIVMSTSFRFQYHQVAQWSHLVAATLDKPFELDEVLAVVQACSHAA